MVVGLKKSDREAVRIKFGGKCAYCGNGLPEKWHADHLEPIQRGVSGALTGRAFLHPDRHRIDNLMPACPPCNISKGSMGLEVWREWLAGHVRSLNAHHKIYRMVKAYGLVQETGAPVVFYFERIQQEPA